MGITRLCVWRDSFRCVTWLIQICDMTQLDVWHDSIRWASLVYVCDVTHVCVGHDSEPKLLLHHNSLIVTYDSFMCVTWLIPLGDMTYSYVWYDLFIRMIWRISEFGVNHSYVCCDPFMCVTWLIHVRDMTHSYVRHDSFIRVIWRISEFGVTHS